MAVNLDPQVVPDFVMEALKAARREYPSLRSKEYLANPHHYYRPMFDMGHVEAAFWMLDNNREAYRAVHYGAVCEGYRPIPTGSSRRAVVNTYHKELFGGGTMSKTLR
jgi:hypothetical protein